MHPILFKIPLPSFHLPYAWIPFIVAALAALYAVSRLVGKERDVPGAAIGGIIAGAAIIARFTVLRGNTDGWDMDKLPIYSYGVMLGLSLVVGWYLTLGLAERDGLPKETMANCYVVTAIAAVAGARILYILTNLDEFTLDPQTHQALPTGDVIAGLFAMRRGGLVAYGGFLGGYVGSALFLRSHKIPLFPWADVAVPSLASGLMITRIGCYLFGCDFGQPLKESAPRFLKRLGTFPHWDKASLGIDGAPAWQQHVSQGRIPQSASESLPVHPTQLYESLVGAGILVLLLWARRRQKFRGEIMFLFFFAYGVCRYMLEIIRDDAERGSIPPSLPEHQLIPFGLVVLAGAWCFGFSKAIKNLTVQRITQVASFLPAIALFIVLQPAPGTFGNAIEFSTSQFIALTTAVAASVAFAIYYKAALARPKHAMDLGLPREFTPGGGGGAAAAAADDDPARDDDGDDGEEAPVRRPAKKVAKAKAKKGKPAKKRAKKAEADESDDAGASETPGAEKGDKDTGDDEADEKSSKAGP